MKYLELAAHYEACLDKHKTGPLAVDWPNEEDANKRYSIMRQLDRHNKPTSTWLDYGCGTSEFYAQYGHGLRGRYTGVDISPKFISECKHRFPQINKQFYCRDILLRDLPKKKYDYIICNGVFTMKTTLTQEEMLAFFHASLKRLWQFTRTGLAFNVMSKHVDWERDDLFHLSYDDVMKFCVENLSRNVVIRADYGLYEFTVYIYK